MAGSRGKRTAECPRGMKCAVWVHVVGRSNIGRNARRGGTEDTIKEGGQVASQPRRVVSFLQV